MRHGGFTLIELMVVVAIISILAAIAVQQFASYRERSYLASMLADLNSIRTAEGSYFAQNGTFKTTTDPGTDLAAFGAVQLSEGNSVRVEPSTDITKDFKITVTSTKTTRTVVFDSITGQTVTN